MVQGQGFLQWSISGKVDHYPISCNTLSVIKTKDKCLTQITAKMPSIRPEEATGKE